MQLKIKNGIIFLSVCTFLTIPFAIQHYTNNETLKQGKVTEVYAQNDVPVTEEIFTISIENYELPTVSTPAIIDEKVADISQKYTEVDKYFYINKDTIIKAEDNETSADLLQLPYGSFIHCIGEDLYNSDGYYKILINDQTGYINTTDVTMNILFKTVNKTVYAKTNLQAFDNYELKTNPIEIKALSEINVIAVNEQLGYYQTNINDVIYYINFENVSDEMQFSDEQKTMYTKKTSKIYSVPNTSSDVLKSISKNKEIKVLGFSKEWAKVKLSNGNIGYVEKDKLTTEKPVVKQKPTNTPMQPPTNIPAGPVAQKAIEYAYSMIGTPYVYGAASTSATDCSGFTLQCYRYAGISLPRTAASQNNCGTRVSYSEAKPGDLLTWSQPGSSRVSHVGMYVGDGMMIHASSSKGVIRVSVAGYMSHSNLVSVVRVTNN